MSEAIAQMAAEDRKPSRAERIKALLYDRYDSEQAILYPEDWKLLREYIELKERQARKAINQRKTLRDLNRAHRATVVENRWLRMFIAQGENGEHNVKVLLTSARETLWSLFRNDQRLEVNDGDAADHKA